MGHIGSLSSYSKHAAGFTIIVKLQFSRFTPFNGIFKTTHWIMLNVVYVVNFSIISIKI